MKSRTSVSHSIAPSEQEQTAAHDVAASTETIESNSNTAARWSRAVGSLLKKTVKSVLLLIVFYLLLSLIGLIPVNRSFVEPESGIEILVTSNAIHSDIMVPIANEVMDWRTEINPDCFDYTSQNTTHLAFGWGDRGFYLDTPTWNEFKTSTAAIALFLPSDTVMHISQCIPVPGPDTQKVRISKQQYQRLVDFIKSSFERDSSGAVIPISNASYGSYDAFFHGAGKYHCFRTCNCWTGSALKSSGVKVGWFTPLPRSVFLYFPKQSSR